MGTKKNRTTRSQEDYLEAILVLGQNGHKVRINDVAASVGVGKSSASLAVKLLCNKGYVEHDSYGGVTLTDKGSEIAHRIRERHNMLFEFLVKTLELPGDVAEENACRMEHVLSPVVLDRIRQYIELRERCPHGKPKWTDGKGFVCSHIEDRAYDK